MDSTELNSKVELPAETLAILADISQDINASLNLDEVLATAAAQIKRLIDYEMFAVLLPEKNSDQLYFRFAIGHRPEVVEHWRIPMDEGIIGSAAATGQPIRVGDVTKDKRYLNALDSVRSELAVPLIVRWARDRGARYRKQPAGLLHARPAKYSDAGRQPHQHGD